MIWAPRTGLSLDFGSWSDFPFTQGEKLQGWAWGAACGPGRSPRPPPPRLPSAGEAAARLRAIERHAAVTERDPGIVTDDDMVEQSDIQEAAGRQGFRGEMEVVG